MRGAALAVPLVALGLVLSTGCGTEGRAEAAGQTRGKQLFQQKCASCHSLADAGSKARVGPDLHEAFRYARSDREGQGFEESTIRDVIKNQIAYPVVNPATDATGMPANLVTGEDADAVATYIAAVAGLPVKGGGGGGEAASTDGKTIFNTAGCAGCHTFSAAGATGTTAPNLDQSKPSLQLAIDRVTNGRGNMPSFKGQLTEKQIRAVAQFVSQNSGK